MKSLTFAVLTFVVIGAIQFFRNRKRNRLANESGFSEIGRFLYPDDAASFDAFFTLYLADPKKFVRENEELLEEYDFDDGEIKAIELLYIFGDMKEKVSMTDWRGEENSKEVEDFIERMMPVKPVWTNTNQLRANSKEDDERDGDFIIDLFKAIDKDLNALDKKLIFYQLGWDAYVYTVVDSKTFKEITAKASGSFVGSAKLKK
jgi:hypothetical protein